MKIETSSVQKLFVTGLEGLYPITVFLDDHELGKGRITIICYNLAVSAYWGRMGDRTLRQFFCRCDTNYLSKNLSSKESSEVDFDKVQEVFTRRIIRRRREGMITHEEARETFDAVKDTDFEGHHSLQAISDELEPALGEEWWYWLPYKETNEHAYLIQIIQAVQTALAQAEESEDVTT